MTTLAEFLAQQEEHYEDIRNAGTEAHEKGIDLDPNLKAQRGGFFIVLRHAPEIERAAEIFSRQVANLIPAIIYENGHMHTSLGSHDVSPGFRVDPKNIVHRATLSFLTQAAYRAVRNIKSAKSVINYTGFLHSRYVAIAKGIPNQGFVELVSRLSEACMREGYDIKPTWGAHMTVSRFTNAVPAHELHRFFELFETSSPLGISVPVAIEVGYADWSYESRHGHFVAYSTISLE